MSDQLQKVILQNLIQNEGFCRKSLPFLKADYFEGNYKNVYKLILNYITKYNNLPSVSALTVELSNQDLNNNQIEESNAILQNLKDKSEVDETWLLNQTEKWCQDRAIYLAILDSISIIDGQSKEHTTNVIPDLLKKALSVSFDTHIGHDYIDDAPLRYDYYHKQEEKIPFDLDLMNKITKGGLTNKSLTIIAASTGAGKSLFMTHHASNCLSLGKNVLYITLEMSEEKIAERIDANLFDTNIQDIEDMPREIFDQKINKISSKTNGRLIVKEYPTASAHVNHFRALLNELALKKSFTPDIIFIDYLNICASARMKGLGGAINTYSYVKAIAEEVRGLAVEFNLPIVTATQTNRSGFQNSDMDLGEVSESFGTPATADLMIGLIVTEELDKLGQVMIKQLKNRYNDLSTHKRFVVGLDRSKMKLYDLEESAQKTLSNDTTSSIYTNKSFNSSDKFDDFKM